MAGAVAALAVLPAAALGTAGAAPADQPRAALLDDGGATPAARPGTRLAARSSLSRKQLARRLEAEMDRAGGASGAWVAKVRGDDRVLYSDAGARRRLLASNSKLFATAAFLDRFGAEGRLATRVWEGGSRTGARNQILRGGLVLVGDGDPALARPSFAKRHNLPLTRLQPLVNAVKRAGIRRVSGGLKLDDSIFDRRRSVPQHGVTGGPWLSPLSGLSYDSGYDGGRFASDPAKVAGRDFVRRLRAAGIRFRGRIRVADLPQRLRDDPPLARVRSPRVASLIRQTNTPSDNFFAEMLLKRLGARGSRQGTTARGANAAERFADRAGSGAKLVNGSGLSRRNAASPSEVGKLLLHMLRTRDRTAWRDSLAVAGRSGTLASRMRGTRAAGRCQGKTGTLTGVSALSGYCRTGAGVVVFSILMSNVNLDTARRAQDAMVSAIARFG